ncbi:MAG: hypothetical protein J6K32_10725 [Clostridia bacterium]|nr:hypothetical protein [Clostridia bacterium]
MKKKWAGFAAIWLALAVLVLIYTDPDEFAWHYEGEDVRWILVSTEQAQREEQAEAERMQQERLAAAERSAAMEWGEGESYTSLPMTMPAYDEAGGLNLMWGSYTVQLAVTTPEAFDLRMVSAGMQSFIEGGADHIDAGSSTVDLAFRLTDTARRVKLACDLPQDAVIHSVVVRRDGTGVFSRDLAAYALVVGVVLSVLWALRFDGSGEGPARRRDALLLTGAAVMASLPCLWDGLYGAWGHDLFFHLNRIEGIATGLMSGQFPVRIHASTLQGYGYAASQFYPELFLYIPALLRCAGVSLTASVHVMVLAANLLTAYTAYYSARRIFASREIGLGASVLYTLCIYRIANLYVRTAVAEYLAMIFFPLLAYAMVEVLLREDRRWPLLALSMTGIVLSHLLSALFAVLLCALAAAVCLPRLLREPRRMLSIFKAAVITALCALWFVVPLAVYSAAGINTSVAIDVDKHALSFGSLLVALPGMAGVVEGQEQFAYTVGVVPGLAIMTGVLLAAVRLYARGRTERGAKAAAVLLALGGLCLLCATDLFPWTWARTLRRPLSTFFMQIQYPWRLVGVAAPLLCMAAAWGYLADERRRSAGMAALGVLSVVFAGMMLQGVVQQGPALERDGCCDTRIRQHEYTYIMTEKSALEPGYIHVGGAAYSVTDYHKQGTDLSFTLSVPEGGRYIEVPLLYYPGYHATVGGEASTVTRGTNNVLRLLRVSESDALAVRVWYEPPMSFLVSQGLSLLGAALLLASLVRMRRWSAA